VNEPVPKVSSAIHHSMAGEYDPVLGVFRDRIYSNDNDVFLIVAGKRGSCKSGSSITLGYLTDINSRGFSRFYLDPKYYPKDFNLFPGERMPRVIYYPSQLLDMLSNFKKYPKGTCVLWDEVGVEGDARDFASKKNKLLKRTFNTVRSLNWFIILTSVTVKDFDVAFGRAAGFYMNTWGKKNFLIDGKVSPYARAKLYEYDVNPLTGMQKTPYLTYYDPTMGRVKKLDEYYYIKKPPMWLEEPYKRYKKLFQTKLYEEYANELDNIDDITSRGKENVKEELDIFNEKIKEILGDFYTYYDTEKKKFSVASIMYEGKEKVEDETMAKKIAEVLTMRIKSGKIKVQGRK
jgi:hypothetical protein